jgi:dTDP-D-glucose 4,6-dehydratase
MLDISKAIHRLSWQPVLTFSEMVAFTAEWYAYYRNRSVLEMCREQIQTYEHLWAQRRRHQ